MNEETRKNNPSGLEIQNNELNDEELDQVNGGAARMTVRLLNYNRRCAANPIHMYVARNASDVCPYCGSKEFVIIGGK